MRFPQTILGLAAVAATAALTLGMLAAEPLVRGEMAYPFGPLDRFRGGAFEVDPNAPAVDLQEIAARARRELPGSIALVFEAEEGAGPMLVVGPVGDEWNLDRLERWRNAARLPLLGPDPIGLGMSAPDFFSAPRRRHDMTVAIAAIGLVAATGLAIRGARRYRRSTSPGTAV